MHTVAAVQMISSPSVPDNLATARRLVTQAAGGAQLVLLPEYWAIMGLNDSDKVKVAEPLGRGRSRTSWPAWRASSASG
jgi:nitrilase